ncbi:hypothetical protein CAPTEDRAFT_188584 [Capitella teleta]|uniref:Uncharacterized protein n=1 Tax=Capitella teleta TaxID=283909 RepID=R7UXM4_CAPTE|nr:hypothetical protein CAPTEDRAFT_188584 [Capitella teleta]|eukprot:ELU11037.1 hypothetical protein CAPTEDRAFT_188584 [Capitella teleta]
MNAYKRWVRAVWFENGREVEGVAPGTWIKRGTVFWPKGTNAEPAYLDREEPNEKTWRSFKLVKVKFTSDKEEDCHEYDATTAEEEYDQDNRRGVKRKKEEDFLYEMDEADGALEQVLDDKSNDQTKDKGKTCFGDRKLNNVLRRLSSSKKKQREDFRKSAEVRTAQEPKIRDMSGDGAQSLVGFDGDQEHSLINKSDMQSAINILIPPIPPCTPSRTNEPPNLEQNLNMDGQRGAKTAFRGSSLHVLIVESVLEKFSSTVTEQRIDEFIRNRLRNATKRQK